MSFVNFNVDSYLPCEKKKDLLKPKPLPTISYYITWGVYGYFFKLQIKLNTTYYKGKITTDSLIKFIKLV